MRDLALLAVDEACRAGAPHAEARAVHSASEAITVRDQRVEGLERDDSRGIGVRVLCDGAWGFAATSGLDADAVQAAAHRAVEVARASATLRRHPVRLAPGRARQGSWATPHDRDPLEVPASEKLDLLLAATAEAGGVDGLSWVEASADAWRTESWLVTSEGHDLHQVVVQVSGGLSCVAVGEEVQRRSYPGSFRGACLSGGWEEIVALDLPGRGPAYAEEAVALLSAPEPPAAVGTVVIGSNQLALQAHESVGHALELDRILGHEADFAGTSFVTPEDLGSLRYGSPQVSLTLDSTTPRGFGTYGYDDEGTPAQRVPLVVEGRLEEALTSRETAATLDDDRTSNGTVRAESWDGLPLVRMSNLNLEPGEGTLEELLSDTGEGLLLETNSSWSIDDKRVSFQFGCEVAYEIRRGRRGRLLRNPVYSGRTIPFWQSCDAVCGEEEWSLHGTPTCGKGAPSQRARVGHGTAPARFRDVETGAG